MQKNFFLKCSESYQKSRLLILMIATLFVIVLAPFIEGHLGIAILFDLLLSFVLFSAVFAVQGRKIIVPLCFFLLTPLLLITWASHLVILPGILAVAGKLLGFLFFGLISCFILAEIFKTKKVTDEVIYGAITIYLFLGVMWGFLFGAVEYLSPGSFSSVDPAGQDIRYFFFYYSFVTLTTLGYGDVAPLTSEARSLAISEAIIGQIYLTVLIARLVGMHIVYSGDKK